MTDLFDLHGRRALITGGSAGIGLAIATAFARSGAAVAVAGRDRAKAEAGAAQLRSLGVPAVGLSADVADEGACRQLVEDAVAALGGLDILVNNAGTNQRKPPET